MLLILYIAPVADAGFPPLGGGGGGGKGEWGKGEKGEGGEF